jgi:ribosomal protein S18 acetylase RimI-like enzyme
VLDVIIRQAVPADADAIAAMISTIEPETLVSEISREERRDRFFRYLSDGLNASFLAEYRDRLVGELSLELGGPEPSRVGFGVHPTFRRNGIARRLLKHAIAWSDERDIHKLTAEVMTDNTAALTLLQKEGFREEGYLVNHFRREAGGARDAILLGRISH